MGARGWDDSLSLPGLIVDHRAVVDGLCGCRAEWLRSRRLARIAAKRRHLATAGTSARFRICRSAGPKSSFGSRFAAFGSFMSLAHGENSASRWRRSLAAGRAGGSVVVMRCHVRSLLLSAGGRARG